jgi:hypothetical protein
MRIERGEWSAYLAELSRQAEGYRTTIEVLGEDIGDQIEAREVPLRELAFDPREGIALSVGGRGGEFPVVLRHVIPEPVDLETTDEPGIPGALMIEQAGGRRTVIRLAAPITLDRPTDDEAEVSR